MQVSPHVVFGPEAQSPLVEALARGLGLPVGRATLGAFADGERSVRLHEDVVGRSVVLVMSTCPPVDANTMLLALAADAARRGGAARVLAIVPYLGYSRSDRVAHPGEPVGCRLVATLLESAGVDAILTVDLHTEAIGGFFRIPVVEVSAVSLLATCAMGATPEEHVVVAPDAGAVDRATRLGERLGLPVAVAAKRRVGQDTTRLLDLWGEVAGRHAILVDDLISTGGTVAQVVGRLRELGAKSVDVAATHAVMARGAEEKLREQRVRRLIVSDTVPFVPERTWKALEVVSVVPALIEAAEDWLAAR